jgi:hypothetical protein
MLLSEKKKKFLQWKTLGRRQKKIRAVFVNVGAKGVVMCLAIHSYKARRVLLECRFHQML